MLIYYTVFVELRTVFYRQIHQIDSKWVMGYRSLEWNWPKEAMNRPIGAGIVDGAKLF